MRDSAPEHLLTKLHGAIEWSLIEAAIRSQLFDLLDEPENAEDIADKQGWCATKTSHILDALTSIQLLMKSNEGYHVSAPYRTLLNSKHPDSMIQSLCYLSDLKVITGKDLLSQLSSTASPSREPKAFTAPGFWSKASDNLRAFHRSVSSDYCAQLLSNLPCWPRVKRMLDIGAGTETLALRLLENNDTLECHIFDLGEMIAQITKKMPPEPTRLTLHSGDYNTASLPTGFDLVFASMSLYYVRDLTSLLKQVHQGLEDDGCLVSLHEGLKHARTSPAHHVVGRLLPAMNGNDVSFNYGHIAKHLLDAGFRHVHSQSIVTPFGPMELDIAYK